MGLRLARRILGSYIKDAADIGSSFYFQVSQGTVVSHSRTFVITFVTVSYENCCCKISFIFCWYLRKGSYESISCYLLEQCKNFWLLS